MTGLLDDPAAGDLAAAVELATESERVADERHQRIARDSVLLTASYGATALVGVVFWTVAARTVPAEHLGVDTAVLSAVTAAATIAGTGVANAFLALLPLAGTARGGLLRLGYLVVASAAFVCGLIGGLFTEILLPETGSPLPVIGGVALATTVWSLFVVQDPVLTAFGKAHWLLAENLPVNVAKLSLLPVFVTLAGAAANPVVLAALLPAGIGVVVVSGVLIPRLVRAADARERATRTEPTEAEAAAWLDSHRRVFGIFVLRDSLASALNIGFYALLPFVVTAIAGPVDGAVFALCLQVSSAMDLITAGVGVSLTTNVAADVSAGPPAAVRMWKRLVVLIGGLSVLMVAGSPILLHIFGQTYLDNHGVLVISILAVGALLRTPFEVWTALLRAQRRTGVLLAWTSATSALLLVLIIPLTMAYGALGAAGAITGTAVLAAAVGGAGMRRDLRAVQASLPISTELPA